MDEICMPLNISYVVFDTSWENYLAQRGFPNEEFLYNTPCGAQTDACLYLTYLRNSLATLTFSGLPGSAVINIWVLKLASNSFCDELRAALKGIVPEDRYRIRPIETSLLEHLINYELHQPAHIHKSPNKIHEFLLYHVMSTVEEPYLFIPDADTLFLKRGIIEQALGLLRRDPIAVACSFMDTAREIQRNTGLLTIPERMHTVALFFKVAELRAMIDLEHDVALQLDFSARIRQLDGAIRQFFETHRQSDTLSFLTELLKQTAGGGSLLDLNATVKGYFEAAAMTIGCESFLHGKYLDPHLHRLFLDNFARDPITLGEYQRAINYCLSLPVIPRPWIPAGIQSM